MGGVHVDRDDDSDGNAALVIGAGEYCGQVSSVGPSGLWRYDPPSALTRLV